MDQELDRTLNQWDEQSCAEFEAFLDEWLEESGEENADHLQQSEF